jgi:uncharacterized coiled-coil protein SlyX
MAQIIKHRRGSLESLSAVTSSLQKGEIVIASGSSNLSVTNGASIVFAVPENGQVQAVNRFLVGDSAPNTFSSGTYNGMLKGVPYYASGSSTLYLLGEGANEIPNLVGNIQPFSASVATSINALSSSIGSGTIGQSVTALNSFSASTLVSLQALNSFSASQEGKDSTLATYTASVDVHISNVNTFTASADGRLDNLESTSASVNTSISNINSTTASLNVSVDNLNSFTSSFSQSVATSFSASAASVQSLSASVASVTGDFSASVATQFSASDARELALSTSVDSRLDAIESTYATTGANVFTGTQTITGSLYITQDLVVYGSSSLLNVTASRLDLGDNTIVLNTATPAVRFAGIDVIDSGSTGATGSLYWDSLNNHWLYVHPSSSGEGYNSAIFIAGPKNTGSLGEEVGLTAGYIPVAVGEDHIDNSLLFQTGSKITLSGDLDVTGNISGSIVGIGNVSAFSQSVDSRLDTIETSIGSGGSLGSRVDSLETSSANLNSFTSSADGRLSNLESTSASVNTSISNINSTTASLNVSVAELNSFSASAKVQLANLETTSASVNTSVSSLNTFSSSTLGRLTELESKSASVDVSISNINSFTSSFSQSVATSFSASAASVTALSASVASVTGDFSSSVATSFSQSSYNLTQLSSSVATTISNLDSAGYATDAELSSVSGAVATTISNLSSSVATSFSASNAADAGLSARITTLEGTGSIQGLGTGNNVTFAKVTTSGDVVVGGDLVVQGNTVTLNTATLVVEDKLITLASGSTSSATADGAGFEVAGADANFVYQHSTTAFTSSVALIAPAVTASINLGTSAGSSKRIAFRNTNGNLDLVPTASVAGDLLQWNGSDFVMSNVIDGGSF